MKSILACRCAVTVVLGFAGGVVAFAQGAAQPPGGEETAIRLNVGTTPPLVPPTGKIEAYTVTEASQLAAGQLADTFFGDYVLQNDAMRVTISRPDKPHLGGIGGGHVIDVISAKQPNDYLNYVQHVPDVESTASQVKYTYADEPTIEAGTTATVVLHGQAELFARGQEESEPAAIDVTTTYSLAQNDGVLHIATAYTNSTSATVQLQPGDMIDWGQASTFVEGVGLPGNGTMRKSNFVTGFADNFSLGYVTSGSEQMDGLHTIRDSLITAAAGEGDLVSPALSREERRRAPALEGQVGFNASASEDPRTEALKKALQAARLETSSGSETSYASGVGTAPTTGPLSIANSGTTSSEDSTRPEVDDTGTTTSTPAPNNTPSRGKTSLAPGETFTFERSLVISDRNFGRIAEFAYSSKGIETGAIAGAVLDNSTEKPIPYADIFISGGPNWDGNVTPAAFYRTQTGADGTFVARLPQGKYLVSAARVGRGSATPRTVVDVTAGSAPQVLALSLTAECIVSIAVSEAETETSSPLPCKVTFIPKQGTLAPDWGMGPRGDRGVRNVCYLPYGAARIPLSPGNYVAIISRGIEYDIVRDDIQVRPGQNPVIKVSLPHSLKGRIPGMFSLDPGLMTSASAVSNASPEDRIIQAVCEGVHLITSGDYHVATDLQATAKRLGLDRWIKAFTGVRILLNKGDQSAEVLAYPLSADIATSLTAFAEGLKNLPPDVALSDLRRSFPKVMFTVTVPTDPLRGYLTPLAFDEKRKIFDAGQMPPPDFDALQVLDGKKLGVEAMNYPRYMDLQIARTQAGVGKAGPLAPTGASNSRLTYGEEVGYPRIYLYTNRSQFSDVTADDIVRLIKGQRFLVTNGPVLLPKVQKLPGGEFVHTPGDVVDLSTTEILRLRVEVFAAPWVSLSGITVREYGWAQASIIEIRPHDSVRRYPVQDPGQTLTRYFSRDAILDVQAYGNRRALSPVVPDALIDFGGPVYPFAYTAPYFVDKNGDGRIELEHEKSIWPQAGAEAGQDDSAEGDRTTSRPAPDEE